MYDMISLSTVTQEFREAEALILLRSVFQICGTVVFALVSWKQSRRGAWGRFLWEGLGVGHHTSIECSLARRTLGPRQTTHCLCGLGHVT